MKNLDPTSDDLYHGKVRPNQLVIDLKQANPQHIRKDVWNRVKDHPARKLIIKTFVNGEMSKTTVVNSLKTPEQLIKIAKCLDVNLSKKRMSVPKF